MTVVDNKLVLTSNLKQYFDVLYRNTRKMLEDYNADCNVIIPGREVAAIHYAAGMDNTLFAENVMKLMLKNGGLCQSMTVTINGQK